MKDKFTLKEDSELTKFIRDFKGHQEVSLEVRKFHTEYMTPGLTRKKMEQEHLVGLLRRISKHTDTDLNEIIDCLTVTCFDEEEASQLKELA